MNYRHIQGKFLFLKNHSIVIISGFASLFLVVVGIFLAFHLGGRIETIARSADSALSPGPSLQAQIPNAPSYKQGSLTGKRCASADARPVAVMLSADSEARPLAGIGSADIVVEMPVVKDGINRFMAVFQCTQPSEIGSIRSARPDFIPLAAGFDAVYAHWGGSHIALDELSKNIIDNLDALVNPFNIFYRKTWIPAPHNGFTSFDNLTRGLQGLHYSSTDSFVGYPRTESTPNSSSGKLVIQYPSEVQYNYSPATNGYARLRAGRAEIDALTQQQVHADIVIVMRAPTHRFDAQYNRVDVTGTGQAVIFQNGGVRQATWHKDGANLSSKLMFLDSQGKEIPLVEGVMWLEVADPTTPIVWNGNTP